MNNYQGQTDQIKKIELPSSIQQVLWTKRMAAANGMVGLDIFTHYVGNNSELKIEISDQSGKTLGIYSDKIHNNHFWAQIKVPDNAKDALYATAKLPKHGLEQKSGPLIILPPIEITNAKWDKKEARRGDILKLTADIKGVPDGMEAQIEIWEYDSDNAHDLITKFPVIVKDKKIEAEWEYEYHEDTDEIPTEEEVQKYGNHYNPPEYFFRVRIGEVYADSGLVEFKDWMEIQLKYDDGDPVAEEKYILKLPDGIEREGQLDENGYAREENVPPGKYQVIFPEI